MPCIECVARTFSSGFLVCRAALPEDWLLVSVRTCAALVWVGCGMVEWLHLLAKLFVLFIVASGVPILKRRAASSLDALQLAPHMINLHVG